MSGTRSQARETALQALYQHDLLGPAAAEAVAALLAAASPEAREYARQLIEGVLSRDAELTTQLKALVEHWAWERVAVVDRTILKIGAFELQHVADLPPKVALDEAIELAKRYSTRESGAFVNGILDRIHRQRQGATA